MNPYVKREIESRLERSEHLGEFYSLSSWGGYRNAGEPFDYLSCDEIASIKPSQVIPMIESGDLVLFSPHYTSGSDYGGDTVTKANYLELLSQFGGRKCIIELSGMYDTYGIMIDFRSPLPAFWEIVEKLDDYPLIDDEKLYEVESEAEQEAWELWLESDLKSEICKTFNLDCDDVDSDSLRDWLYTAMNETNQYFIFETGGDAYVRIGEILKKTSEETDAKLLGIGFYDPESVETV